MPSEPQRRPQRPGRRPLPGARRARRSAETTGGTVRPHLRPRTAGPSAPGGPIRCRVCRAPMTTESALVPVAGQAVHHRSNPAGEAFTFGCFDTAPGAVARGPATARDTWFAGHSWRLAHCGVCGVQLGWRFDAAGGGFWGLILERLASDGAAGDEA